MSTEPEAIAVYGGSFDPPHVAHVLSVVYALSVEPLARVIVVPVCEHVFPKRPVAFEHRARMCELALEGIANAQVSRVEAELSKPNLTLNTLRRLQADHPSRRLRLLIGSDVLGEVGKWHSFDEVSKIAPPLVIARHGFERPGHGTPQLPGVSSTQVRDLLQRRDDAQAQALLCRWVPWRVLRYIDAHGLYR